MSHVSPRPALRSDSDFPKDAFSLLIAKAASVAVAGWRVLPLVRRQRRGREWRGIRRYGVAALIAAALHATVFLLPATPARRSSGLERLRMANAEEPTIELAAVNFVASPDSTTHPIEAVEKTVGAHEAFTLEEAPFTVPAAVLASALDASAVGLGAGGGLSPMALPRDDWLAASRGRDVSFPLLDGRILATFMPQPNYPERARQEARQGVVELEVAVQPNGSPARVVIASSSGSPDLDAAACSVVFHRWRFRRDAEPRRCLVRITFQLNGSAS